MDCVFVEPQRLDSFSDMMRAKCRDCGRVAYVFLDENRRLTQFPSSLAPEGAAQIPQLLE